MKNRGAVTAREWMADVRMNPDILDTLRRSCLCSARATLQERRVMLLQFPGPIEQGH